LPTKAGLYMILYVRLIDHGPPHWTRHLGRHDIDGIRTYCGRFPERIGVGEVLEGDPPPTGRVLECRTCSKLEALTTG
jgi:hypothetical protein